MIYPDSFDKKTGFDQIRSMLSDLCLFSLGRGHAADISFTTDYSEILLRLRQTEEFRKVLLFGETFPLGHLSDVTPGLKKLRIEGTFLETGELFELQRSLDTARMMVNYFKGRNGEHYPALRELSDTAPVPGFIRDKLSSLLTKEGNIKDNATPGLRSIRLEISRKQAMVSKKMQVVMKAARAGGLVDDDAAVAMRNGRPVIPVSASLKRRIQGFVHDESASGKTVFIEPVEVVEINNEIRELENAERREILKILKEFAGLARPYLDELLQVFHYMGHIDFIRAKALFAVKTGAVMPVFRDVPVLQWKDALHPLLYLALKKEKRETVPLDIELDNNNRILLISGPNAGGKSVCLQTVGLLQYMLQCGMLVPMSENSETGLFSGIFIDIGDEQSIENDLSTYSSHLLNMKFFVRQSSPQTLILIDEFGTGTEPMLGGAIAEAILEQLNKNGTFGVITTHYTSLKHFAASCSGIVNGAMLFDTGKMEPLFRLETGKPGSSFAFEIARKIGLPEEILQSAAGKVGEEHIHFDRHLKDIIRDKHYWDRKRKNIRQIEKKLGEDLDRYEKQLTAAEKERKEIISRARDEARQMLEGVNRKIENTIREIRETQADKEKTREARNRLSELKQEVEDAGTGQHDIGKKIERLRERQAKLDGRKGGEKEAQSGTVGQAEEDGTIRKGDMVKLSGRDIAGEVLDINGM
jgi:DNA mismatch repair protein MutS2